MRRKTRGLPAQSTIKTAVPVLLSISEELGIGFLAGVASRAISTPLSVITVRLQTRSDGEGDEGTDSASRDSSNLACNDTGIVGTVKRVYAEEGLQGFWGGTQLFELSDSCTLTLCRIHYYRPSFPESRNHAVLIPDISQPIQPSYALTRHIAPVPQPEARHTERTFRVSRCGRRE